MLDLTRPKELLAELRARPEMSKGGVGDRERESIYYLNIAAYLGESWTGRLIAEIERLRGEQDGLVTAAEGPAPAAPRV